MIMFQHLGRWGRFGNQLFQYATLFAIAKKNQYQIGVPFHHKSDNPYANFVLDDCFEKLNAESCLNVQVNHLYNEPYPNNIRFNPDVLNLPDNTNIHGYFQSEKYFKNYKKELLNEFKFKDYISSAASFCRNKIPSECISVHVRVGDYKYIQNIHPFCSKEYYYEAIQNMPSDLPFVLFSDDIGYAAEMFKSFSKPTYIFEINNDFIEMCLMTKCEYHIIANSSFSWWGSWLGESKKTIAPQRWFGNSEEAPKDWSDIYADGWHVI